MEDSYPNIEIKSNGKVHNALSGPGYYWEISTSIAGPDDRQEKISNLFETRQKATEHMLEIFEEVVKEQLTELLA